MTDLELQELRRAKWNLDGRAVHTLDAARSFVESVGFCLMYPQKPALLAPTFVGAWVGSDDRLPPWQQVFADPRAQQATELMVRLLRERDAYEANLFGENNPFLIAGSLFPYFYGLVGERNPKQAPKAGPRSEYSELACDTFAAIQRGGPISKVKLQETLGGSISTPALDRALAELGSKLRITRVDYNPLEGSWWDVLYRWSPDAVHEGMEMSVATALSALLSKYLDCVIAADWQELESFFGNFVSRSRVREAGNALLAAREIEYVHVGNRSLIQITPPKVEFVKPEFIKTDFKKREFRPADTKRPELRKPDFKKFEPKKTDSARPAFKKSGFRKESPKQSSSSYSPKQHSANPRSPGSRPSSSRPPGSRPSGGRPGGSRPGGARPPGSRPSRGRPGPSKNR
jgi:23S rRNA pseudouridine2605 synthase